MNERIVVALMIAVLTCGSVSAYAASPGTTTGLVDIDLKNVPVKQAIDTIFDGRGLRYIIEPGVTGKVVELKLKGITVAEALKSLGDAAGFSVAIEEGIYVISPKTATAADPAAAPAGVGAASTGGVRPSASAGQMMPSAPVRPRRMMADTFVPSGSGGGNMMAYAPGGYYSGDYGSGNGGGGGWGNPYFGGYYSPFFTIGPPPYVIGQWPNPPPPPGWVSTDWNRLLQFQWVMNRRPSFITPY